MTITNQSQITFGYTLPDHTACNNTAVSNEVTTNVLLHNVSVIKSSDKVYLDEGETAKQTVTITNESDGKMTDVHFKDVMSHGATYVAGTVHINGTAHTSYDPAHGFALPDIPAGESVVVTYEIISDEQRTRDDVTNKAEITYKIKWDKCCSQTFAKESNTVTIELISTNIEIVKSVDKTCATQGEKLHYTSVITNKGSVKKTYIFFRDQLPDGVTFVKGSVMIDETAYSDYDPEEGFALTDFAANQTITVTFDVLIS